MKRIVSLVVALVLSLATLSIALAEPADIANQYYAYSFYEEGYGDFSFFFHFYEADPVLGAVFYAGMLNNNMNFAGLYTVEEKPYDYACYPDRETATLGEDERVLTEGTAPYTIHFLDWNGEEFDTCGWDGSTLYNDCKKITGPGSGPMFYHLTEADGEFKDLFAAEAGMPYLDFVAVDDSTCTVSLCHNGTYTDMMVYYVDGNWQMTYDENGNAVYAFTPFDDSEDPATLTVAPDQRTAVYTNADGETTDMVNMAAPAAEVVFQGEGTFHVAAYNVDSEILLTMYDDDTCELTASVFGNSAVIDQGTYAMDEAHTFSFTFEKAGSQKAILSMTNTGDTAIILNYANAETDLGDMKVSLVIKQVAEKAPDAEKLFSFKGTYTTLDVYADSTYMFAYDKVGLTEKGTWSFENDLFSITQSNDNVITAAVDEAKTLTLNYVAVSSDQLKDTFTCSADVWEPALGK